MSDDKKLTLADFAAMFRLGPEKITMTKADAVRLAELTQRSSDEITRLRAELATARRDGMEEAAMIAEECYRQNGPLSQRGFPERYRAGLAAGAQAIAAAIRAAAGKVKP